MACVKRLGDFDAEAFHTAGAGNLRSVNSLVPFMRATLYGTSDGFARIELVIKENVNRILRNEEVPEVRELVHPLVSFVIGGIAGGGGGSGRR